MTDQDITVAGSPSIASVKGTVREKRRLETRAAVLKAAAVLFSEAGFRGVAVDDIAKAAGVRKNNLLYHFSSKEELWKETVDMVFGQADEFFATVRSQKYENAWEGFEAFLRSYFEACRRFPAYILMPMIEGVSESWRTDYIAERHLSRHVKSFDTYVRSLVAQGVLPPVEPLHLQNILTGGAQLFLATPPLWRKATDTDTQDPAFVETYAQSLLGLIKAACPTA